MGWCCQGEMSSGAFWAVSRASRLDWDDWVVDRRSRETEMMMVRRSLGGRRLG